MTLKELRITNGLNQESCAKYLGISTRTYQTFETDKDKEGTPKYNALCAKLQDYGIHYRKDVISYFSNPYLTNVITDKGISALYKNVENYKKRGCFYALKKYIDGNYTGKVCILYGLRRTGKTTLIFQMFNELPIDQIAYIKIKSTDNMANLTKDLNLLFKNGYKYIFIDEITLLDDFINTAAILSDIFSSMGMKIVLSGTDSLGFISSSRDELYDRAIMIHTSFIPFSEYNKLLSICSIDKYIEYGGTLKMENMGFDDPDNVFDDVSFKDDESTRKYIDSAISRNIQHTLKNDNFGQYFNELKQLYTAGELTNIINRIVENLNHEFVLKVIEDKFKSHDLGSCKNLMLHNSPDENAYTLYEVDQNKIVDRLKQLIDVKEQEELKIAVSQDIIEKVKKYLMLLDLVVNCKDVLESGKELDHYIFTQPGMRYSIAKALVYSLMQDEYFASKSIKDKQIIIDTLLNDVKDRMLEEIVLLETNKVIPSKKQAFKYKFDNGGEFDMVVLDKTTFTCDIYEIKHSKEITIEQCKNLLDENKCKNLELKFGYITNKYVLYRGESIKNNNGITYLNVEEYLNNLYDKEIH